MHPARERCFEHMVANPSRRGDPGRYPMKGIRFPNGQSIDATMVNTVVIWHDYLPQKNRPQNLVCGAHVIGERRGRFVRQLFHFSDRFARP